MTIWHHIFCRFGRNERGATAVIVALMITVLVGAAGVAVDFINLYQAKANLQIALDNAVLAAASGASTKSSDLNTLGNKFVAANVNKSPSVSQLTSTISYNATTNLIEGKASASFKTSFVALLGLTNVTFKAASAAARAQGGPLDLVLVLDKTSSMDEKVDGIKKIQTLRDAANSLVKSLMGPDTRVGVVKFAEQMGVNASTYINASWIDVGQPVWVDGGCGWAGTDCRTTYYDCIIDGVKKSCPYVDQCKTQKYVCNGGNWNYWMGCLAYRPGYETVISNPQKPKYRGIVMDWGNRCNSSFLDMSSSLTDVTTYITNIYPSGETYIPGGLLWGWNMLDPEEPLTGARTASDLESRGGEKVMVLMTDGYNTRYVQSDGTVNSITTAAQRTATNSDTSSLCTKIKDDNIKLFTVAFDVTDQTIIGILRNCATTPEMAFTASNTSALKDAFSSIGSQLKRVHLTN
ncbi:MAG: pilus assembly protein [Hyphomicrobiales bacterium]